MANWLRMMWQGVVNRTIRMLASGPLGQMYQITPAMFTDKPGTNSMMQADGKLGEL
ncbi:hypothetical protein KIN20_017374 [Parelaphostrongylus tenuis]|uniref:Uncharacterized protein n=1 Tax=Parelaphostrongylus tenuis TaxID=148309 RepID=A0AAD5QQQ5_PARTN|nr:hypothetical protein KIN20_017374 [Parelaphostrongylus tenuis]